DVMQQLGLSAKQQQDVKAALADVAKRATDANKSTSSNPLGGGGMPNMRAMFGGNDDATMNRQRVINALSGILSEDQMQKYTAMSTTQTERMASVYVVDTDGKPAARQVRVGLSDDNYTEVISGLAEGDKVIVRAQTAAKS
ncbi:MAG TPA: hypothetical protein VMI92_10450, partial [Steroidobacteraceae bacterium]|nr:hypothetical protein [Steroidobacteraceae bacterium]